MRAFALALPPLVSCGAAAASPPGAAHPAPAAAPTASAELPSPPALSAPVPPPRAAPLECPRDMVTLPSFCIDRYEAPNAEGALPFALKTALDGEAWCAGRGKRLCTEEEWVRACEGPDGRRFPYGSEHREGACNDDRAWIPVQWGSLARWPERAATDEAARLFQGERSGTRPACISAEGVFDLTGNVAEWVRRSDAPPRAGYDHVLKGCYWAGCYHERHPNCAFRNGAHPGSFRTYEAGFRCCRGVQTTSSGSTGPGSTLACPAAKTSPSRT